MKKWWNSVPIGTRSVLIGAHCWCLHPWFVAWAWWKLYGFPFDPRLWVCFFVHDLGYLGKPNMDGAEGELHPILGANIVRKLFGKEWGEFCILHSRFFARRLGKRYSRLCCADKYAIVVTPSWVYLPMVQLTGELREYMDMRRESKYAESNFDHSTPLQWHKSVKAYIGAWVKEHKDVDRDDSWIKGNATEVTDINNLSLPGYLEGGYEHDKYIVLKKDGTPINAKARYMVLRYDANRDPNGIFATLAYAISVRNDNPELASGIITAIGKELNSSEMGVEVQYSFVIEKLMEASNLFENANF